MKSYIILCLFVFLVSVYATDVFTFDFECKSNGSCLVPGEEYCGDGEVKSMTCNSGAECEVTCFPIKPKPVDQTFQYSRMDVTPADKRVGIPLEVTLRDSRDNSPLVWDVEIYFGGTWKTEELKGASHWGGTATVVDTFTDYEYVGGELLVADNTDRQGKLSFVPQKPGGYVVYSVGKYIRFIVGDELGNKFDCGDGACETILGEDMTVCPEDCEVEEVAVDLPPPKLLCGDGICSPSENETTCPADCKTKNPEPIPFCGDGVCELGEDETTCLEDCKVEEPAVSGGIDMGLVLIAVVIILLIGFIAFQMKTGKLVIVNIKHEKTGAKPAPPQKPAKAEPKPAEEEPKTAPAKEEAKKEPKEAVEEKPKEAAKNNCTKCGTPIRKGSTFCVKCGAKV